MPFVYIEFKDNTSKRVRVDSYPYRNPDDTYKFQNGMLKVEEFEKWQETHQWLGWPESQVKNVILRYY